MKKIILIICILLIFLSACANNTKNNIWCKTDGYISMPDGGNLYHITGCLYRYIHTNSNMACLVIMDTSGNALSVSCER